MTQDFGENSLNAAKDGPRIPYIAGVANKVKENQDKHLLSVRLFSNIYGLLDGIGVL